MSESWRNDSVYRDGSLNYGAPGALCHHDLCGHHLGRRPFVWMFVTSIKPDNEVFRYPPTWWPERADPHVLHAALRVLPDDGSGTATA